MGAGTETKAELEEMLGITDLDAWNAAIKAYLEKPWAEETFVLTANSVWMQQDTETGMILFMGRVNSPD